MSFLRTRLLRLAALAALSSTLIACGDAEDGDAGAGGGMTDPEAPASCDILASVTGTYTVTGDPTDNEHRGATTNDHQRGTIVVADDFGIDFDEGIAFSGADIATCYDRTNQDHDRRIQVSYDSDDSGRVINLYLTAEGDVDEVQFRHSNEGVNVRALVSKD